MILTDSQTAMILVEGNKIQSSARRHIVSWLPGGDRWEQVSSISYAGVDHQSDQICRQGADLQSENSQLMPP